MADIPFPSSDIMTEIIFRNDSGNFPEAQEFDEEAEFGGYAIGYFFKYAQKRGNGFIVKLLPNTSQFVALVLTVSHVFFRDFDFIQEKLDIYIGEEPYEAFPLKTTLDWNNPANWFRDPITKSLISVPEDWVLCLLTRKQGFHYTKNLVALTLADPHKDFSQSPVYLVGYPKLFREIDIYYVSPEATVTDYANIISCLKGCNKLIATDGVVKEHQELLGVSCISANGMSGSPFVVKEGGDFKVIGLLHGGPASPIHYYTSNLLHRLNNPDMSLIDGLADYLKEKYNSSQLQSIKIHCDLIKHIGETVRACGRIEELLKGFIFLIYQRAISLEYETGNQCKHNLGISLSSIYSELENELNKY